MYTSRNSKPRSLTITTVSAVAILGLAGCTIPTDRDSSSSTEHQIEPTTNKQVEPTIKNTAEQPKDRPHLQQPQTHGNLEETVAAVADQTNAQLGVAVIRGDDANAEVELAGNVATEPQPAWSSIKVPLSIAALRQNRSDATWSAVQSALTSSDNQAAETLWQQLGGGVAAASAVGKVLAESGDQETQVNAHVTRPGFSAFGQTRWSLENQARFAKALTNGQLAADDAVKKVRSAMGNVVADQAYGLGQIDGAEFKGGWGPNTSERYDVRQFGIVPATGSAQAKTFIAISANAADGSYESGQAALNKLVDALFNQGG